MKAEHNPYQDRESGVIKYLGLTKFSKKYNAPYDAVDEYGNKFEVKSKTGPNISSVNSCNINHINKWREINWIVTEWDVHTVTFGKLYLLRPQEMKQWLDDREEEFNEMERIRQAVLAKMDGDKSINQKLLDRMLKRSVTIKDPRLPFKYVLERGIIIKSKEDLYKVLEHNIIPPKGLQAVCAGVNND